MTKKPRFIMCFCTGECPGFSKLQLWPLINFARNELDVEYAVIHPQLCVENGDSWLALVFHFSISFWGYFSTL